MFYKFIAVIPLFLLLTTSCATLIPQTETVIRLPQEHEYVSHSGRIPVIYIYTSPREYWDFALQFRTPETNGVLMTGEALYASLQEGLSTVFKTTRRAASGDFRAIVNLDHFTFGYKPAADNRMEFQASLNLTVIDAANRRIDDVSLHAKTIVSLSRNDTRQLEAAVNAVAELLSMMEKDLANHVQTAWAEGRYATF